MAYGLPQGAGLAGGGSAHQHHDPAGPAPGLSYDPGEHLIVCAGQVGGQLAVPDGRGAGVDGRMHLQI
ncbi:hypothetical protein [Nonomuraea sp. JJY05]|uniref:hypothetical protein n=1 Tax=Nonomuraea sp. JJY05 TaxID=3350255 RepID=UPI00373E0B4A